MNQHLSQKFFKALLIELQKNLPPPQFFNGPKTIQSSVGLIFRKCKQAQQMQLLFTQRGQYEGDSNKLNVVFPGGQCDGRESDLQACKRELQEEIGLNTDESCNYLGHFNHNFYYTRKRQKSLYVTCHAFLITQQSWVPTLNPDELRDFRWVHLSTLLDIRNYASREEPKNNLINRMKFLSNLFGHDWTVHIKKIHYTEVNLGMDRNLWGLTLWMWHYALDITKKHLENQKPIEEIQRKIRNLSLSFEPGFAFSRPINWMAQCWSYLYRQRQFSETSSLKQLVLVVLLSVGCLLYLFM